MKEEVIDLTRQALTLRICGECQALTREADYDGHVSWHASLYDLFQERQT